jgi:arginine/lysine/ornithine decarboxylase
MTPREAWFAEKEAVPFEDARGRTSAEMVVPYPPGIPILCPGEIVTDAVHDFLAEQRAKGRHLHCAAGDGLETLSVVR